MADPTTLCTKEIADFILSKISDGNTITKTAQLMNEEFDLDVSRRTVSGWISKYDGEGEWFSDSPRAYREGYDARAEDCFRIAEDETIDTQRARLRIDTNLRVLGKFAPKKYGDKIDVNAKVDISFGDMISEITDLGKDDQHKH